jgi:hypothetical protein
MRIPLVALLLALGLQASSLYAPAGYETPPISPEPPKSQTTHVIKGRVVDPYHLKPEGAVFLTLGREDNDSFGSHPIALYSDGSFVTPRLSSGAYVLELLRTSNSAAKPAMTVGFRIVTVGSEDVSDVIIEVRRDTSINGRFRMESDTPMAEWPSEIIVGAPLALDGMPLLKGTAADGAPSGKFVLRNAFGPRVVRCGYTLAGGHRWWFSRVVLNGVDVTNVPTDFSEHDGGELEVVFTQHPARIEGTVTDNQGQAVQAPWILVSSADKTLWQRWATTSHAAEGDRMGRFSVPVTPGSYVVSAVARTSFLSWQDAKKGILGFATKGGTVSVKDRETKLVNLTVQDQHPSMILPFTR